MQSSLPARLRRLILLAPVVAAVSLAACESPSSIDDYPTDDVAVVLNSIDRSLSVYDWEDETPRVRNIGLGAQGTPVGFAVEGGTVLVPMGTYPFAAVVNLRGGGTREGYVTLPQGSGATGAALLSEDEGLVANAARNTVTPVNPRTRTAGAEIAVGVYPQFIADDGQRYYVVNANLVNFSPAGNGSVTVIDRDLDVVTTIGLSGRNSGAAVVSRGKLYVLHAGDFGGNNGSLSVVDLQTLTEERHVTGFGEFPGSIAAAPNGDIHVGVYGDGVLVWDPDTRTFVRGPANPLLSGALLPVASLAFDPDGRLNTVDPDTCEEAGQVHRVTAGGLEETSVEVGVCPFFLQFTRFPS